MRTEADVAHHLLSAAAVREGAAVLLARAERGQSAHFVVRPDRLDAVVDRVLAVMRERYPALDIPFHSRWRHFEPDGVDRWAALAARHPSSGAERARVRFDLAIVSVLLDAGAGVAWAFRDADGRRHGRSEGLGLASLAMFTDGVFSDDPSQPLRCDGAALERLTPDALAQGMQSRTDNPLAGIDGRALLLNRLGRTVRADAAHFGTEGRVGRLFDAIAAEAALGSIAAARVLQIVLRALGPIWPGRHSLAGLPLGDCWPHPAVPQDGPLGGFVPLHKLSQWLTYSLLEPLAEAGIAVTDLDSLTGLAEYRNGGLLLDGGLLALRDAADGTRSHAADSVLVVEWRALTVALLDRVAQGVRARLGLSAAELPLARVLEGGTWAAGRTLARERRADGGPPLAVATDGTLF